MNPKSGTNEDSEGLEFQAKEIASVKVLGQLELGEQAGKVGDREEVGAQLNVKGHNKDLDS